MADLSEAIRLIEEDQPAAAREIIVDSLYQNYDDIAAWLLLTQCAQDTREYARAIREALRIEPENPEARRLAVDLARTAPEGASGRRSGASRRRHQRNWLQTVSRVAVFLVVVGVAVAIGAVLLSPDDDPVATSSVPAVGDPEEACRQNVEAVLQRLPARCGILEMNEVCLANAPVSFDVQDDNNTPQLVGDRIALESVNLVVTGDDEGSALEWGMVVIRARSSFPSSTTDAAIFVATSGVRISAIDEGMLRFNLSSNPVVSDCPSALPSGVLVLTQSDGNAAEFTVNDLEISLEGSAFLQVDVAAGLRVVVLNGTGQVSLDGVLRRLSAGQWIRFGVNPTLAVQGPPGDVMVGRVNVRGNLAVILQLGEALGEDIAHWELPQAGPAVAFQTSPTSTQTPTLTLTPRPSATSSATNTPPPPSATATLRPTGTATDTPRPAQPTSTFRDGEMLASPAATVTARDTVSSTPGTTTARAASQTAVSIGNPMPVDSGQLSGVWECVVSANDNEFRYVLTIETVLDPSQLLASAQLPDFGNTVVLLQGSLRDASTPDDLDSSTPGAERGTGAQQELVLRETEVLVDGTGGSYGVGGELRLVQSAPSELSGYWINPSGEIGSEQVVCWRNR